MKTKCQKQKPTRCTFSLLRQICNFIPNHLVPQLARETGVEDDARTYTPWSQVLTLLFAQLTHSLGLNDVCDALALHSSPFSAIRGATAPKRNTLSYATGSVTRAWLRNCFGGLWSTCRISVRVLVVGGVPGLPSASNG